MRLADDQLYSKRRVQSYNGGKKLSLPLARKSLDKQKKKERNSLKVEVKTLFLSH